MAVRKLASSWQYDFKLSGHLRQRKAGFRTKAEALEAERQKREDLIRGRKRYTLTEAYQRYVAATRMKDRSRDTYECRWKRIKPVLGHYFVEQVNTVAFDELIASLPQHLSPKSVNEHLVLARAVLRFMWKRGQLEHVPYVPMQPVPEYRADWYTEAERDRLLDGMFERYPNWYCFFYLTCRLGLRRGEVYAIAKSRIRDIPPQLVIDRAVQQGNAQRKAMLVPRKNNRVLTLPLPQDAMDAIRWHVREGYSGPEFLFSKDGRWAKDLNSHIEPLQKVQRALGLRVIGHHQIGRHSLGSQAATSGHSLKIIQATLGHRSEASTHRYAHLGDRARLRLVESLQPTSPPHVNVRSTE